MGNDVAVSTLFFVDLSVAVDDIQSAEAAGSHRRKLRIARLACRSSYIFKYLRSVLRLF